MSESKTPLATLIEGLEVSIQTINSSSTPLSSTADGIVMGLQHALRMVKHYEPVVEQKIEIAQQNGKMEVLEREIEKYKSKED
jgi:vacuolar-type H+-ATPase subunit D/Vma8